MKLCRLSSEAASLAAAMTNLKHVSYHNLLWYLQACNVYRCRAEIVSHYCSWGGPPLPEWCVVDIVVQGNAEAAR